MKAQPNVVSRWDVVIVLLVFLTMSPAAKGEGIEEYTAKSVLALNLARFSDWPAGTFIDQSIVNLCVFGDETVQQAFALIDKMSVGTKSVAVKPTNSINKLEMCQLVFVSMDSNYPKELFEISLTHHIMTIGETDDFLAKGGMVLLKMVDTKIHLHINVAAFKMANVWISARVLKLATIYNR